MNHTPGPWTIEKDSKDIVKVREHAVVATCTTAGRWDSERTQVISPEECIANARLIAAAPELLEALNGLVNATCFADPPKLFNDVLCHEARVPVEFVEIARAAIAKARGQG